MKRNELKHLVLVYTNLFRSIVKQALFAFVNHARIRSWNQLVLSNEGKSFLLKETTGAFDGA